MEFVSADHDKSSHDWFVLKDHFHNQRLRNRRPSNDVPYKYQGIRFALTQVFCAATLAGIIRQRGCGMPIYEYVCPRCEIKFEKLRPMDEGRSAPCPTCHEESRKVMSVFTAVLSNSLGGSMPISGGGCGCAGGGSCACAGTMAG
ncbi:MAG: zinc ribbon domain-containing protein [Chloroflexota bacterium]|nr:zinc ribbon domain-containing protein [Chloroflexota bacterium]